MERSTLIAVGALVGVGLGAGALWLIPDAVSQVRQISTIYAESPADCDLSEGRCTADFDDGQRVHLEISPTGIPTETPLTVQVRVDPPTRAPARVELQGLDMNMGLLSVPLSPAGEGAFTGTVVVPVCTKEQMRWHADVVFDDRTAGFGFQVEADDLVGSQATYGDFTVQSSQGPLSLSDYRNKVVVVYFGYTSCPDICPTTLQTVAAAFSALEPSERERVAGLMVSLDPERDSLEHLATYTGWFGDNLRGGTESPEKIAEIAERWGVAWRRVEDTDSALGYTLDHDTRAFLVAPDGHVVGFVRHGTTADALARQIRTLL